MLCIQVTSLCWSFKNQYKFCILFIFNFISFMLRIQGVMLDICLLFAPQIYSAPFSLWDIDLTEQQANYLVFSPQASPLGSIHMEQRRRGRPGICALHPSGSACIGTIFVMEALSLQVSPTLSPTGSVAWEQQISGSQCYPGISLTPVYLSMLLTSVQVAQHAAPKSALERQNTKRYFP